jgi:methionine synthase II (cobalamin-independent)
MPLSSLEGRHPAVEGVHRSIAHAVIAEPKWNFAARHRGASDIMSDNSPQHRDKTDEEFLRIADRNVEALNHAIRDLPPERMRLHVCWGNYEGPHNHDIPLSKIIHLCFKARPIALSFEGANPRHEHEWEDLEEIRIPEDRILIPGVIDSTTNFVEHPRLVAQRICRYANIVGREREWPAWIVGLEQTPHRQTLPQASSGQSWLPWRKVRGSQRSACGTSGCSNSLTAVIPRG